MTSGIEHAMDRVRAICLALPNAVADSLVDTGIRALSDGRVVGFKVSRRVFARMFVLDPEGREQLILWIRADPEEREFLLGSGHPYFRAGPREVGVVLDAATDWTEVPELITELLDHGAEEARRRSDRCASPFA